MFRVVTTALRAHRHQVPRHVAGFSNTPRLSLKMVRDACIGCWRRVKWLVLLVERLAEGPLHSAPEHGRQCDWMTRHHTTRRSHEAHKWPICYSTSSLTLRTSMHGPPWDALQASVSIEMTLGCSMQHPQLILHKILKQVHHYLFRA